MYRYEAVKLDYSLPIKMYQIKHNLEEYKLKPKIEFHWHDQIEVILPIKGDVIVCFQNQQIPVKEGNVIVVNSNEIHRSEWIKNTDYYEGYCIQIDYAFLKEFYSDLDFIVFHHFFEENKTISDIMMSIRDSFNENNKFSSIYINGLILNLFYYLLQNSINQANDKKVMKEQLYKTRIKEMISYIHMNYMKDINAKSIAKHFELSEGHFVKLFKEQVGETPKNYINDYRLSKSAEQLYYTDFPVLEIALDCGFSNLKSFYTSFRNQYQMTPKQYRIMIRKQLDSNNK